jgi:Xaa-Pro aminopeptidase
MVRHDLPALLIASEANVGYLSGFTGDAAILIVTLDRGWIVSDGRYEEQISAECSSVLEVVIRPVGESLWPFVGQFVATLGLTELAFEGESITVQTLERIREGAPGSIGWRPVDGVVESLRAVKDSSEIAAIRDAIGIAECAFYEWLAELDFSRTEKALADELDGRMRRGGAVAASFPVIAAAGSHAALPHARPRRRAMVLGQEMLLVDWGADGGPYKSDLTRVLGTDSLTATFETVYRTVLAAQQQAIGSIRAGVTAGSIDDVARRFIADAGFGPQFAHSVGHGVGRVIHESPFLRGSNGLELRSGMVMTIEPGIYLPGWGGIRIEDVVCVTESGCEVMTSVPRSLEWARGDWRFDRGGVGNETRARRA